MSRSSVYFALGLCLLLAGGALAGTKEEWKKRTVYQVLTDRFWRSSGDTKTPCLWKEYCGGDHLGIMQKLDYIKDLGFDAIWISPIVDNVEAGYHGYWARNWEKVNHHFGSEDDLKQMIDAAHAKGIWVMLDIVANHAGCYGHDYSSFHPFNKEEYFHEDCDIKDFDNQTQVEQCRLLLLPDLDQDHPFVREYLKDWIKYIVKNFNFDGIRLDTAPHIEKGFWKEYLQSAGVFNIGEALKESTQFVASYQDTMDSLLNYPMYFAIKKVFDEKQSMKLLHEKWVEEEQYFKDVDALGLFVDNHDNPRFRYTQPDVRLFKSALAFSLTGRGIPFYYYGSEIALNGGYDPENREGLFDKFDQTHEVYKFTKAINQARVSSNAVGTKFTEKLFTDDLYAYTKGDLLVVLTNKVDKTVTGDVPDLEFADGDKLCNIFDSKDCLTVTGRKVSVSISNGDTKIYTKSTNSFFKSQNPDILEILRSQ